MGILEKWRFRQAFKFGSVEHLFSKALGVLLITVTIIIVVDKYSNYEIMDIQVMQVLWIVAFALYCIYFTAHKLEKAFFPK